MGRGAWEEGSFAGCSGSRPAGSCFAASRAEIQLNWGRSWGAVCRSVNGAVLPGELVWLGEGLQVFGVVHLGAGHCHWWGQGVPLGAGSYRAGTQG